MDAWIEVDRAELEARLKSLRRILHDVKVTRASITSEDGQLIIQCGGATTQIPARGSWLGKALVRSRTLLGIASLLPPSDSIRFEVSHGKLGIGSFRFPCEWSSTLRPAVELPLNPSLSYLVAVHRQFSTAHLRDSGIEHMVLEAVDHADRLVRTAAKALGELGISTEDVQQLVTERLPEVKKVE